jgi:hypothetical protein
MERNYGMCSFLFYLRIYFRLDGINNRTESVTTFSLEENSGNDYEYEDCKEYKHKGK